MKIIYTATVIAALAAPAAMAATTVSSVSGVWTDATTNNGAALTLGGSTLSWGSGASQSSYSFTASGPFGGIEPGDLFDLGGFVHSNYPIGSPSLETAELTVDVIGDIDGTAFAVQSVFNFDHEETPNAKPCPYPGLTVCDDKVTATLNAGASTGLMVDGTEYFFTISGFEYGGAVFDSFLTGENMENLAVLKGTLATAPVPLPATALLLLGGLGALGAYRRKTA